LASVGSSTSGNKKQKIAAPTFATSLLSKGGSLAIALQTNRRSNKSRTTFVQRGASGSASEVSSSFQKSIAFNHVVFHSAHSKSQLSAKSNSGANGYSQSSSHGFGKAAQLGATKDSTKASFKNSDSLFAKLALGGYNSKKR
jgi:hypothetical protein